LGAFETREIRAFLLLSLIELLVEEHGFRAPGAGWGLSSYLYCIGFAMDLPWAARLVACPGISQCLLVSPSRSWLSLLRRFWL
jgi:hypothetical protein